METFRVHTRKALPLEIMKKVLFQNFPTVNLSTSSASPSPSFYAPELRIQVVRARTETIITQHARPLCHIGNRADAGAQV